jgi:uncharacterized delta-60 repeat protein
MSKKLAFFQLALVCMVQSAFAQEKQTFPNLVVKGYAEITTIADANGGGYFIGTQIDRVNGVKTASISKIDELGNPVSGFVGVAVDNQIYQIQELANGKILIAGTFNAINGTTSGMLVRLNADGTLDNTFTQLTTGSYALSFAVQQSGKIVVCGDLGNATYRNLIRLNANGTIDNTFTPLPTHSQPFMNVVVDSQDNIYLAGLSKIFKMNSEGVQVSGFPIEAQSGENFWYLRAYGDQVLVTGYFTSIAGTPRKNIAIINADGSIAAFSTQAASYYGKAFLTANGSVVMQHENAARIFYANGTSAFIASGFAEEVFVDKQDKMIVAGGEELAVGGGVAKPFMHRYNTNLTIDNTFQCQPSFTAGIQTIAVYPNGQMLIGGDHGVVGIGSTAYKLARINADGTHDLSFTPALAGDGITSVALQGDKILVCSKQSFRRLNANGTLDNTFPQRTLSGYDFFTNVKLYNNKIYVSSVSSNEAGGAGMMRLNADGSVDDTFKSALTFGYIADFTFQLDGKILLAGGMSRNETYNAALGRLNTNGSIDNSFSEGNFQQSGIFAVTTDSQDRIYIAGDFLNYASSGVSVLARLSANGVVDEDYHPNLPFGYGERIDNLLVTPDDELIAGVDFYPYGKTRLGYAPTVLALLDQEGHVIDKNWTFGMNSSVNAMYSDGLLLYVAGRFSATGNSDFSPIAIIPLKPMSGTLQNLSAERSSGTTVSLSWTNGVINATSIVIERSVGNDQAFSEVARVGASANSYSDVSASGTQKIYYRIKAINALTSTAYTSTAVVYPALTLDSPTGITTGSFSITWQALTNATEFKVSLTDNNDNVIKEVTTTTRNLFFGDLAPYKIYHVRFSYLMDAAYHPGVSSVTVRTRPETPVITTIEALSQTQAQLDWTNPFSEATTITIYRSQSMVSGYIYIAEIPASNASYTDNTLSGGQTYFYRVVAANSEATTDYSEIAEVTTDELLAQTITFNEIAPVTYSPNQTVMLEATTTSGLVVSFQSDNEEVATISGNTLTILSVGDVMITATAGGNATYADANPVAHTLTINKATQIIDFHPASIYGYSNESLDIKGTSNSGLTVLLESSAPEIVLIHNNRASTQGLGTVTITAYQPGNENYLPAEAEATITIVQGSQSIIFSTLNAAYEKSVGEIALSATATSGLPVVFESSNDGVVSIQDTTATVHAIGTVTITASQTGNEFFMPAPEVTQTIDIGKSSQSIAFTIPVKTLGDEPFELNATASSGLSVTYSSAHPAVASVEGNIVTMHATGEVLITASQEGNEEYLPAEASAYLSISRKSQEISFVVDTHRVGDSPFELNATASSGLPVTYTSTNPDIASVIDNLVTIHSSGTVKLVASQAGDSTYLPAKASADLVISNTSQIITFDLIEEIDIIRGQTLILQATASSGLPVTYKSSNKSIVSLNGDTLTLNHPGNVKITATQAGDENYEAATPVERVLRVRLITAGEIPVSANVDLYPNPTYAAFTIAGRDCFKSYTVVNTLGYLVKSGNIEGVEGSLFTIDLSGFASGLYHVTVIGCQTKYMASVVKQ